MVALHTQTRFALSTTDKIVVKAAVRMFCADKGAARRINRSIENPSRETGRIIVSGDDGQVLIGTLQAAVARIQTETKGSGQLTCQALQAVIARIKGN